LKVIADSLFIFRILGVFCADDYSSKDSIAIAGESDNREWKKNLLEVEQVQDFIAGGHNFGEVFVVKSEFNPTDYAIQGKWAPVYEYYIKDENGEMVRIGSGKINEKTEKMETTISIDGKDRSNAIRYNTEELVQAKKDGTVIQFDSSEYRGTSIKTSRKDIEQSLTTKSIQAYLGKERQIADITKVKDMQVVTYDEKENPQTKNAYIVACFENGAESYEMVCVGEDGNCEKYPGMSRDIFAKKDIFFPTGMSTGYDKQKVVYIGFAPETFKSKNGIQYSIYRDKDGILRVAQIIEYTNGNGKYAEELDTYSVMHRDIDKAKAKAKIDVGSKNLSLKRNSTVTQR